MTSTVTDVPRFPRLTEEYVKATVECSVTLSSQVVEFSINRSDDGYDWVPGQWLGSSGTTRMARTVDPVVFDDTYPRTAYQVFVRVTDSPEIPIMSAGSLTIG